MQSLRRRLLLAERIKTYPTQRQRSFLLDSIDPCLGKTIIASYRGKYIQDVTECFIEWIRRGEHWTFDSLSMAFWLNIAFSFNTGRWTVLLREGWPHLFSWRRWLGGVWRFRIEVFGGGWVSRWQGGVLVVLLCHRIRYCNHEVSELIWEIYPHVVKCTNLGTNIAWNAIAYENFSINLFKKLFFF